MAFAGRLAILIDSRRSFERDIGYRTNAEPNRCAGAKTDKKATAAATIKAVKMIAKQCGKRAPKRRRFGKIRLRREYPEITADTSRKRCVQACAESLRDLNAMVADIHRPLIPVQSVLGRCPFRDGRGITSTDDRTRREHVNQLGQLFSSELDVE
jgi:hypothetical protein